MKRFLALLLAAIMVLSMTACGGNTETTSKKEETTAAATTKAAETQAETTTSSAGEVTTITFYPNSANVESGTVGGYKADFFKSQGLEVEVWAFSDEKTNAMLVAGDLPDVFFLKMEDFVNAIEAGYVLNLDDYKDQLPHIYQSDVISPALNYIRTYLSNDTGKVYGMTTNIGDHATKFRTADSTERYALKLRWDEYEAIGCPEIKDLDDVVDVMEKMLEVNPAEPDGTPHYGTILNNGQDGGYWGMCLLPYAWYGYGPDFLQYGLEADMANGKTYSMFEETSLYKKILKFYNQVYLRDLLDPDSINNDRATQKVKVDAGYGMIPSGTLPGWADTYKEYYIEGTKIYYNYTNTYGNTGAILCINAKTENLDAALKFVDMQADPDALIQFIGMPEGTYWQVDDKGVATLTDSAIDWLKNHKSNGDSYVLPSGEKWVLWNYPLILNTGETTSYTDKNGNKQITWRLSSSYWAEECEYTDGTENNLAWVEEMGYANFKEWLGDNYVSYSDLSDVVSFCKTPDSAMKLIIDAIRDVVTTASWKMVYAENDAQFESFWSKMVEDAKGLGVEDVQKWELENIENAKAIRNSLK